jgi:hypothetical protein
MAIITDAAKSGATSYNTWNSIHMHQAMCFS